jgi:hypothetical protein
VARRFLPWLAGLCFLVGAGALINNARTSDQLKQKVLALDGQARSTQAALSDLNHYAAGHMNASAHVELSESYDRAEAKAEAQGAQSQVNPQVYSQAQAACSSRRDSVTQARCVSDYVSKHAPPVATSAAAPSRRLYQYSFVSPRWTPDLAGLSLLAGVVALAAWGIFRRA